MRETLLYDMNYPTPHTHTYIEKKTFNTKILFSYGIDDTISILFKFNKYYSFITIGCTFNKLYVTYGITNYRYFVII